MAIKHEPGAPALFSPPPDPSPPQPASLSNSLVGPGKPRTATLNTLNTPIHINVGGKLYTSSLDTLTK